MYWALVLEQDRKPPVRQPLYYAIKWLHLKFRMYISLHSEASDTGVPRQAGDLRSSICAPPSFLREGL
eukprot:7368521-Pyramimonas_sp.AAC.1